MERKGTEEAEAPVYQVELEDLPTELRTSTYFEVKNAAWIEEAQWWAIRINETVHAALACVQIGAEEIEIPYVAATREMTNDPHILTRLIKKVDFLSKQQGIRRLIAYTDSQDLQLLSAYQNAGFRILAAQHHKQTGSSFIGSADNGLFPRDTLIMESLEISKVAQQKLTIDPKVIVRRAELGDSRHLLAMKKKMDLETTAMLYEPGERRMTDGDQLEQIRYLLRSSNCLLLIAESDGEVIGYLEATGGKVRRNQHTIYVVIGILESYTGKSLGRRMFENMFEWAERRRLRRAELTVQASNQRAYRLYRSLGFHLEGIMREALIIDGEPEDLYQMGCHLPHRVDK
ncbi:GNAT family N-acetyltransferase [Saccharibacillus sp. JS10]|uniref:GNAT family N-acetyltransferase n=1 Tax=Saccharibacillus sp. JS10 TaxID=2950552 RepID=UPI00210AFD76|nr:GNAT family N-acetyltransferase [Saccharibacillus sp. JS10]MCQ4087263.1 GNAT family N-acetyltransferase [Saccharibacillus sp. JS10]